MKTYRQIQRNCLPCVKFQIHISLRPCRREVSAVRDSGPGDDVEAESEEEVEKQEYEPEPERMVFEKIFLGYWHSGISLCGKKCIREF